MLKPGDTAPDIDLPLTIDARFKLSDQSPEQFTMLVFYRGKHCPVCKNYLTEIGSRHQVRIVNELVDREEFYGRYSQVNEIGDGCGM